MELFFCDRDHPRVPSLTLHEPQPRRQFACRFVALLAPGVFAAVGIAGPVPGQGNSQAVPQLELPWIFADHMVLLRDRDAPVFGTAPPATEVQVRFGEALVRTTSDKVGAWRVALPSGPASTTGRDLVVSTPSTEQRFRDVLVGEVWLCAGQSNMDFPLGRARGGAVAATAIERTNLLRVCNRTGHPGGGARRLDRTALANITPATYYRGSWQVATSTNATAFSAIGAFFGLELAAALEVPIGLIDLSIGGSTTEGWIPHERLSNEPDLEPLVRDHLTTHFTHPFIRERTLTQLGDWVDAGQPRPRPRHFFDPGFLFESAIRPLAPFAIRGVLWYQGESNAHLPVVADRLFRILVEEWRQTWSRPELPFHFVQLPGMERASWPEFREVQRSWLDLPHTGMAVAIDVGHPTEVHPVDKQPVGERLARLALAAQYGRKIVAHGPTPTRVLRHGNELEVAFEHAKGLTWAIDGGRGGFEVSGSDRRFYPAHAEIRGDKIVLRSPEVAMPLDARYAWAPFPECGLQDAAGLPAAPFKTHAWRPTRIACIGDSITAGFGLAPNDSYPAQLQRLLGSGCQVRNLGRSGTGVVQSTMRGSWHRAYRRNPEHQEALSFSPDVVISNLGINDIMTWSKTGGEFVDDYVQLLDDFGELTPNPRIMLWSPLAPLFAGQRFHGDPKERQIHAAIAEVVRRKQTTAADLHTRLRDHPEWFPDHIHPNARGAAAIASTVFDALVDERVVPAGRRTTRLYVLTGQSNSLGTTADTAAADTNPDPHPADPTVRLFWSNHSTRTNAGSTNVLGDSGGQFTSLRAQQGEGANPTFWGPEIGFGRALFDAGERDFALVKASRSGGGNSYWSKGSDDDHMYHHLCATVRAAIAALPPGTPTEVAALLYLQGESDSPTEAEAAGQRLTALARNLRRDLPNATRMRVLVAGIAAPGASRDVVRRNQKAAAERDDRMAWFSTLDLENQLYDGLHFDRTAKLEIGRRFARVWHDLGGPTPFLTPR